MYLKQKDETTEFKGKILSLKALRALRLSASFCTYACGGWAAAIARLLSAICFLMPLITL